MVSQANLASFPVKCDHQFARHGPEDMYIKIYVKNCAQDLAGSMKQEELGILIG